MTSRQGERSAAVEARLVGLQKEMSEAEVKLKLLYKLVEDGHA